MPLNEDQKDWVRHLNTLPAHEKCECGWYLRGQCPNCDKPKPDSGSAGCDESQQRETRNLMSATILNHPAKAAELVCHDEQMVIWAGDLVGMLSTGDWLKEDLSFDDGIELQEAIKRELRSIIAMAFTHPELKPR